MTSEQRTFVTNQPENSETPLDSLRSWVTSNRLFFVRNHFQVPNLDRSDWRLSLTGLVEQSRTFTWDDLQNLPQRTVFATMECAGNGRSFLSPHVHGVQWGAGAIGHAEWTGVPLRVLLDEAGVSSTASEVLFEGADRGSETDHPAEMAFSRSLPLKKALDRDTLIATRMNGELLEPNHGAPARLIVPGWYGVASVKWLTRIAVLDHAFAGYFQTTKYTVERQIADRRERVIVGPMALKSEIIRPRDGDVLGLGTNRIFGVAWAGEDAVRAVEVSTDGGQIWQEAELVGPNARYSWTLWEYLWETQQPSNYSIMARAVSASGNAQPTEHSPLSGGYMIHFSRPTQVKIEDTSRAKATKADAETLLYDMAWFSEENSRRSLDVELELADGAGI